MCFLIIICSVTWAKASEVTNSGNIPQYQVNAAAIAAGPANNISSQNLCNGDQAFTVLIDRELLSQGGQSIPSCEMSLNPYFAQLFKSFVPKCAKEAALKNGMDVPTSVSVEQLGGYVNRNARNSSKLSRHALGMAMDISSVTLRYRDSLGRESVKRIELSKQTNDQAFYDSFRSCWDASVAEVNGKNCACSVGHSQSREPSNELHDNHMHLALACPPGGAITCSNHEATSTFAKALAY